MPYRSANSLMLFTLVCALGAPGITLAQERTDGRLTFGATPMQPRSTEGGGLRIAPPPGPGVVAIQKRCCSSSGGGCQNVPSNSTCCGSFQTAKTCDDNGQNCEDHGTSEFPED